MDPNMTPEQYQAYMAQMAQQMTPEQYQAYMQQYYNYYYAMSQQQQQQQPQQQLHVVQAPQVSLPPLVTSVSPDDDVQQSLSAPPAHYGGHAPPMHMAPPAAGPGDSFQHSLATEAPPPDRIPTNCIWVGFPVPGITEDDLRPLFAPFGPLESVRALQAKNCGFVYFADKQDAWRCHQVMSQAPPAVRGVHLRIAWGRATGPVHSMVVARDELAAPSNSLWVGNLPQDITEDELRAPFSRFGKIDSVRLIPLKKCAFVTFTTQPEAEQAIRELQGYVLRGERIRLNFGTQQTLRGERDRDRPARAMLADDEARLAPVAEAPPPADPALAQAIDTLARFVNRLGLTFEELVRDQQARNPKYSFLTGGAGSDYYEWRKYDLKEKESESSKSVIPPWQRHFSSNVTLSEQDSNELVEILRNLEGTQESIRYAKDWVIYRYKLAADVSNVIRNTIREVSGFSRKLFILYLVNDILLHSSRTGTPDYYGPAMQRVLSDILSSAVREAENDEQRQRVYELLDLWEKNGFYDNVFVQELRATLQKERSGNASSMKKVKTDPWAY